MEYKKVIIISMIICFMTLSSVSASWHSDTKYRDGECGLFSISCPSGYKNAGEIQHDRNVFISTNTAKRPYHYITVEEISDSKINSLYDDYNIVDSVDKGEFKAYKLDNGMYSRNSTIAIYSKDGYNYILEIEHSGCPYDDYQFKSDASKLESIAHSIYRK